MKVTRLKSGYRIRLSDSEFEALETIISHGVSDLCELGQDEVLSSRARRAFYKTFTDFSATAPDEDRRA
jgi:hypothetical protein